MIKRNLQKALYQLELLWVRGPVVQILLLLSLVGAFSLLGGLLLVWFHSGYTNLAQASWWAFLHLTDTGYMGGDKDPWERVLAVCLTFLGALVFVGGVIAILTTSLDRLMISVTSGRTAVCEEGHLLLLGHNPGLPDLVAELASAASQRWPKGKLPTIVVLSETPFEMGSVGLSAKLRKRMRVIARTGSPSEESSLKRADFTRASVILVLSSRSRRGPGPSDLHVLKTLSALRNRLTQDAPRVVLDLSYPPNARLIPSLAGSLQTESLSSLELTGRLLCQCLRHPGISQAYRQLLSDSIGQSILLHPCPPHVRGQTLGRLRQDIRGGILIGLVRQGQAALMSWEQVLVGSDELVVIAANLSDVRFEADVADPQSFGVSPIQVRKDILRILAVGWNESLLSLARELSHYRKERFHLTVMASLSEEQTSSLRDALGENGEFALVARHLRNHEELKHLPEGDFDRILLLAGEHPDPAVSDAETALRYALLLERDSRFVVELHEESNAPLFGDSPDVLTTDQVINHMLAQVALKPSFRDLYEELFTYGGCELHLLRLAELLPGTSLTVSSWRQLSLTLFERGFLALGVEELRLHLNPPDDLEFAVNPLTRVLILTTPRN